jgi:hypothetical protein
MKDPENLSLLVAILNKYIYFLMTDVESVTIAQINKLIDLIKENINQINVDGKREKAKAGIKYFENTIEAVKLKITDNPTKFTGITVD